MDLEISKPEGNVFPSQKSKNIFNLAQLALRIMVISFSVAGATIMATSQQTVTFFGIAMKAHYSYSPAMRFNVVADSIVCGLVALSVILVISMKRHKSNPNFYFYLLLHDMVSLVLLLSGVSAAMSIGYVGRFGQTQTGWMPICDHVPKFCDKNMSSIVSSFAAVICLLMLIIMSAHKLKSHTLIHAISN